MRRSAAGVMLGSALLLAACADGAPEPAPVSTEVPEELAGAAGPPALEEEGAALGTPMAERVATLGLLNKRNNLSQDLEMRPGEARRVGDVVVQLSACERTAPWETRPETGAFVQVSVRERTDADSQGQWRRIFSGWLFRNAPAANVVEHPIYDVWVKECAMSFPGDDDDASASASSAA